MTAKILVTGGAGFIGSEIVKQLSAHDEYEIRVLDALTKQIHGNNPEKSYLFQSIKDCCDFIRGDVRDFTTVQKALEGVDVVLHLAAETGTGQSMYMINQYNEVNVMGLSNIFQALSLKGESNTIRKVILSSSRSVYGEGEYQCPNCGVVYPRGRKTKDMMQGDFTMHCDKCNTALTLMPTTEDSKTTPNSLYAFTKLSQEMMIQTMCPAMDIDSIFSSLLLDNKDINIFEDGKESRDFIHVKDVASAVIKSINTAASNGEIINLGSGIGTSVIEIAETLKRIYGSTSNLNVTGDFRIGDIAHNVADTQKARKLLDFTPSISLQEGLTEFCEWVLGQETDNSRYEQSLTEMERSGMFIRK